MPRRGGAETGRRWKKSSEAWQLKTPRGGGVAAAEKAHRGWAKLMLDRCRELEQHPSHLHPTAAEPIDEANEEARAFYHHTRPLATGGRPLKEAPCLGISCWSLVPPPPYRGRRKSRPGRGSPAARCPGGAETVRRRKCQAGRGSPRHRTGRNCPAADAQAGRGGHGALSGGTGLAWQPSCPLSMWGGAGALRRRRRLTAGGSDSSSTADGTSFSTLAIPAPRWPRRPMRTRKRHAPSTTTPTSLLKARGGRRRVLCAP